MVLVDVGDDGGHLVHGVREQRDAAHHLGHAQRRVHVQATEVVVDGQELQEETKRLLVGLQVTQVPGDEGTSADLLAVLASFFHLNISKNI